MTNHWRKFVLDRNDVELAHVIIPTADDFGNVAVLHDAMAEARIFLTVARPSSQLVRSFCSSPTSSPTRWTLRHTCYSAKNYSHSNRLSASWMSMKLLGVTSPGIDFIAVVQRYLKEIDSEIGNVVPDPVLQRTHRPLAARTFSNPAAAVPPPSRHDPQIRRMAHLLYESGDLGGALAVLQASRDAARNASGRVAPRSSRRPSFSLGPEIAVVTAATQVPLHALRRQVQWKGARRCRQVWVFKRYGRGEPVLTAALKTSGPQTGNGSLLRTVDFEELKGWYQKVDAKRRRGYEEPVVAALEREGLAPSTAIGISRLGIVSKVRASADFGAAMPKVAALWMGELKDIASDRGTTVARLVLEPAHVADVIRLVAADVGWQRAKSVKCWRPLSTRESRQPNTPMASTTL